MTIANIERPERAVSAPSHVQRTKEGPVLVARRISNATCYWRTLSVYMASDLTCLLISFELSVALRTLMGMAAPLDIYTHLVPLVSLFIAAYFFAGLYPPIGVNPVDELRRLSLSTSAVFFTIAASTFLVRHGDLYSRGVFLVAWFMALFFLPLGRSLARHVYSKRNWWGVQTVILGAGVTGRRIVEELRSQPGLGLCPVAVLDDDPAKLGDLGGVPVIGPLSLAPSLVKDLNLQFGVVAMPGVQCDRLVALLENHANTFRHLLVVPDLFSFGTMRMPNADLGGILGLEVKQQLLMPGRRALKRAIDLTGVIAGGILISPIVLLIAVLIKLDSRGPIFFGHSRIGTGGRKFKAWKFRSMYKDAESRLQEYLKENPALREEWEKDFKLKNDPRVTRLGSILRRTSLDELPQLWNVLKGEMSLVGPRPIVDAEVERYGQWFELYKRVRPGMSGLWQVSGRNDTTYAKRVMLDTFYVRNWSPWLDIHILARTIKVVFWSKGAY